VKDDEYLKEWDRFVDTSLATLDLDVLSRLSLVLAVSPAEWELAQSVSRLVLALRPGDSIALLAHAYGSWEGLAMEQLDTDVLGMASLIEREQHVGAAALMTHMLLDRGWDFADEPERGPNPHHIEPLLVSIDAEPDWVTNRLFLSDALWALGRADESREAFRAAVDNCAPDSELDLFETVYDQAFVGRLTKPEELKKRGIERDRL